MKILGHLDRFGPPVGGGVITTVTILRELARRGHEVRIVTNRPLAPDIPEITCYEAASPELMWTLYEDADFAVPHMTATPTALTYIQATRTPMLYPVHDDGQMEHYGLQPADVAVVVFNSNGLRERTAWQGEQVVVHPPTWIHEHRVERTGDAITISSLSPEKGGETFWKLVERFSERRFIGVIGGWGNQLIPDPVPENVEIIAHQGNDLRAVFRESRVLLVPSQRLGEGTSYWTENWGRAAIEAAASGIPSIASFAPGPMEALGKAGIFRDRNDIDAWAEVIEMLDDPAIWERQAKLACERAEKLESIVTRQLDDLSERLTRLARRASPRSIISHD